ncbi:mannitol dehydrogenase family protein [bacterium]|nr:mannitol dehydrogenase family protein [bacterium]
MGQAPLVVLSCDNLAGNGKLLRRLVTDFACQLHPELGRHIAEAVRFPCSMVDRIVPATTAEDIAQAQSQTGLWDQALVKAEPFSQWVIQAVDSRLAPLARAGALLVEDVAPFETMKLRLLNGSHSMLAYLGYLAGHQYVADAIQAPGFELLVTQLMELEVSPTLRAPEGFSLSEYQAQLRMRFCNRALAHRTWQIAMDGSQKSRSAGCTPSCSYARPISRIRYSAWP